MLLALRSTTCAAALENAIRGLVGSAMSNPSELVHGRDMASPRVAATGHMARAKALTDIPRASGSMPLAVRVSVAHSHARGRDGGVREKLVAGVSQCWKLGCKLRR